MDALLARRLGAWVLGVAALGACAAVAAADADRMVKVGAEQLHVVQGGSGAFTVVFEAGFASDLSVWRKASEPAYERARKEYGAEAVDQMLRDAEAVRKSA